MNKSIADQIGLAQQAASGDSLARQNINTLIHPIISYQTARFCKRFCFENRYRFACTLEKPIAPASHDALLCEWGNASYGWMLNDLVGSKRLLKYQAKFDSSLYNYLYNIGNSIAFYERWKDWRFNGNVHVPTYIQQLHPNAGKVFYGLRAEESIAIIAQKLLCSEDEIQQLSREIIIILTRKRRLHLLDPPATISLTELNNGHGMAVDDYSENDVAFYDESPEHSESKLKLHSAWSKLTPVEQFVLEALIIEQQDAEDVLVALAKLNISIKAGINADKTNRQQLYYFRRKTIAKLNELMN
ncbi:hypothetical protein MNBD_GAMMA22-2322 [hydrothermal vent metagenome]|uniref:Uncharacterized protein n=1 Tax=hydrothermal vent metagenome TaxID=652676 RepID=A0A3B0ZK46_9ZZZZ